MGIEKIIETSTMAPANYHRVVQVSVNWRNRILSGTVASFYSHEASNLNKGCLASTEFSLADSAYPLTDEDLEMARKYFDLADSQELVVLRISFTGAQAHLTACVRQSIAGSMQQYDIAVSVPKTELLLGYLQKVYAEVVNMPEYAGGTVA